MPENIGTTKAFSAAVGLSRKWDAKEAGRAVAEDTLKKLGKKPDFVLLFSTIHYKRYGGFEKLLEGIWEVLPEGTPLVGGTIPGFMTREGCYTRGVTTMAVSYPNMDIGIGIGHNTKRFPKEAGRKCANEIRSKLDTSKYKNPMLYEFDSANTVYQIPGFAGKRVFRLNNEILNGLFSTVSAYLFDILLVLTQKGIGKEEDVFDEVVRLLPEYTIAGGSMMDDNKMIENYQFNGREVYTNSIVGLGIKSDVKFDINTTYGLKKTDKKINVTEFRGDGRTIHKIDNKPAVPQLIKTFGWDIGFFDERIHRRTFFTPLGFYRNNALHPQVLGYVFGDDIICGYRMTDCELTLLSASGRSMLESVDENLNELKGKKNLAVIIFSCAARLESLGSHIYETREKILEQLGETPFLLLYMGGEDTYSKEKGSRHIYESFNVTAIQR